jgi:hypothetical protein
MLKSIRSTSSSNDQYKHDQLTRTYVPSIQIQYQQMIRPLTIVVDRRCDILYHVVAHRLVTEVGEDASANVDVHAKRLIGKVLVDVAATRNPLRLEPNLLCTGLT